MQAQAYIVQSSVDGHTLAARRADAPRAMASITKLMTALVALEHLSLDDVVTVPPVAARIGESTLDLRAGQRISVRDLLIGALVPSANDAATTLAVAAGGSEARFVALMNRKAAELGLRGTHYRNPHGLDEPGHVSTARDIAVLVRDALRVPVIRRYAGMSRATLSDGRVVESTDNLLGRFGGLVGGKTGHTSDAGWSQAAFARSGGVGITAVVLGSPTEAQRDGDLAALLRFGLDSYRRVTVVDPGRTYATLPVGWGLAPVPAVAPRRIVRPASTDRPLTERVVVPGVARASGRRGPAGRDDRGHGRHARRRAVAARRGRIAQRARGRGKGRGGSPAAQFTISWGSSPDAPGLAVIVTVTLNAALDRSLTVPTLQLGQRHRASDVLTLAGGKGINVARALKQLDVPVVATGLAGGRTGTRIVEELTGEAILNDFVRIGDESRTSTLVVDPTSGTQTEINEWGPKVAESELGMLMDKLRYLSRGADAVVLAGSLPRGVADTFYAEAARELQRRSVRVVLDSEGEPLRLGIEAEPWLVSPNQHEAEQIVGQELNDEEDFVMALETIAELGARNVHITLESGCFALVREDRQVRRYRVDVPRLEPVSVVGAGDAFLAQWLASVLDSSASAEEALRSAVAAGAASVLDVGAGRFDPAEARRLAPPSSARAPAIARSGIRERIRRSIPAFGGAHP